MKRGRRKTKLWWGVVTYPELSLPPPCHPVRAHVAIKHTPGQLTPLMLLVGSLAALRATIAAQISTAALSTPESLEISVQDCIVTQAPDSCACTRFLMDLSMLADPHASSMMAKHFKFRADLSLGRPLLKN